MSHTQQHNELPGVFIPDAAFIVTKVSKSRHLPSGAARSEGSLFSLWLFII